MSTNDATGQHNDIDWLDGDELAAWRGLRRLDSVVLAAIASDLHRDSRLSDADYEILTHLSEDASGSVGFALLAEAARWTPSRLSHQLRRMAERGLVERRQDPDDARALVVELTDHGRAAIVDAAPLHVRSVRRHLFDALTDRQTRQLATITDRVLEHHQQMTEPGARTDTRRT